MKIFIVYALKDKNNFEKVVSIIKRYGHEPVVLSDLPPRGTIFDKLISYSKKCDKAIVLYSGTDYGGQYVKNIEKFKPRRRARENVVLELGLFIGLMQIKNVLILLNKNINRKDLPSDLQGVETSNLCVPIQKLDKTIKLFLEQ